MLDILLDLLFPRRSLLGIEGSWLTEDERKRMRLTPTLLHEAVLRKRGCKELDAVIAAGSYDTSPLLRRAILTFKYRRIEELGVDLGERMSDALPGLLLPPPTLRGMKPILCPVPLHWTRKFERGFNQSLILANVIGERRGLKVRELLKRVRATGHQTRRSRDERMHALAGAFALRKDTGALPPWVLLVDDLSTTGGTLDACAAVLKAGGVKYVGAIVAALG